jgi:histone H3/H4
MENISKPAITRLCRKAGIKTISDESVNTIKSVMNDKLIEILNLSIIVNNENQTKTLMPQDIYTSLELLGVNLAETNHV